MAERWIVEIPVSVRRAEVIDSYLEPPAQCTLGIVVKGPTCPEDAAAAAMALLLGQLDAPEVEVVVTSPGDLPS